MKATAHHLQSLDAFRGITIACMIVVNNPGDWSNTFPQLLHSAWNGVTFADLVFPAFVFILGFVLPFAFARRLEGRQPIPSLYPRICKRAASLFALGVVLNATAALSHLSAVRIPGVLQRLALVYLCTSLIVLNTRAAGRVVMAIALLLVHWWILVLVGVSPDHNASIVVDRVVFGEHRLMPTDPEGLLGTLPSIAEALLGSVAGQWIRRARGNRLRATGLALTAAVVLAIGIVWDAVLPMNKPLWTGSFVLVTTGVAALAFAGCFLVIDAWHLRAWATPFEWLGVNPLAMYFLSEATGHLLDEPWLRSGVSMKTVLYWRWLEPWTRPSLGSRGASLAFALLYTVVWIMVARAFYRRGLRLQV
jgi:predicted acyltransferase